MEKLKIGLIVAGIAILGVFVVLFKLKSNKLQALEFKLSMIKNDQEINTLRDKINALKVKFDAGETSYQTAIQHYNEKLTNLLNHGDELNAVYNQLLNDLSAN